MKRSLLFLFAILAFSLKTQAQQIVRISPDSVVIPSTAFWIHLDTVEVTVRGAHFLTDSVIDTQFDLVRCAYYQSGPPFYRNVGIIYAANRVLNDSVIRVVLTIDANFHSSRTDVAIVTDRFTAKAPLGYKIVNPRFTDSFTVTPTEAHPGESLNVLVTGLRPNVDQVSATIQVDFNQSAPARYNGYLGEGQANWGQYGTNFSFLSNDQTKMLANITVPAGTPAGCYDVLIRNGYHNCANLERAFCVTPGTVDLPGRITGRVYEDAFANCQNDFHEKGISGVFIEATPGPYYAISDTAGNYSMEVPLGTFTVRHMLSPKALQVCTPVSYTVILDGRPQDHFNFGDTLREAGNLAIGHHSSRLRPGFQSWLKYYPRSNGELAMTGNLYVKMDTNRHIISIYPLPDTIRHDTLVFRIPSEHSVIWITDSIRPDVSLLGTIVQNRAWVIADGDEITYSDNRTQGSEVIAGSFDPNDKAVWPAEHFLEGDSILHYRIRFQNTGTDTAFFVTIRDTLSPHLDISSVVSKGGSHQSTLAIRGQNVLEWRMVNPMLPDSNVNEPASHGFVEFSIKRKAGLPLGTRIDNRAAIYFDFNPPVMTNYASTTLSSPIRVREQMGTNGVIVYPNPMGKGQSIIRVQGKADLEGAEFQLRDVTGRLAAKGRIATGSVALDRSRLKAGLYSFRIVQKGKPASTGKLVLE